MICGVYVVDKATEKDLAPCAQFTLLNFSEEGIGILGNVGRRG